MLDESGILARLALLLVTKAVYGSHGSVRETKRWGFASGLLLARYYQELGIDMFSGYKSFSPPCNGLVERLGRS